MYNIQYNTSHNLVKYKFALKNKKSHCSTRSWTLQYAMFKGFRSKNQIQLIYAWYSRILKFFDIAFRIFM